MKNTNDIEKIKKMVVEFKLLGYQWEAVKKNLENLKLHGVSGNILATSGGKTYIAMAMMLFQNENVEFFNQVLDDSKITEYEKPNIIGKEAMEHTIVDVKANLSKPGLLSNSTIWYVAPTKAILTQVKRSIVESFKITKYREDGSIETIPNKDIKDMSQREVNKIVKKYFPNLDFKTYTEIERRYKENPEALRESAPEFLIADEVHRSGAKEWQKGIACVLGGKVEDGKLINENKIDSKGKKTHKTKLLTMSATPERDSDGRDMTKVWSEFYETYTAKELSDDVRDDLGICMPLVKAEKQGFIQTPNIVRFDSNLVRTDEYRKLVNIATKKLSPKSTEEQKQNKKEAEKTLKIIEKEIIGIPNFHKLTPEEQEENLIKTEIEVFKKALKHKPPLLNPNGKYIAFAPKRNNKESISIEDFMGRYADKIRRIVKEVLGEEALKNLKIDYIIGENDNQDEKEEEILANFDNKSVNEGGLHFVIAQQKFDEGIHPKNISGSFFYKPIAEKENTSLRAQSILYTQETGRNDKAIIPDREPPEKATIFDLVNNTYIQGINQALDPKNRSKTFDLTDTQKRFHELCHKVLDKEKVDIELTIKILKILASKRIRVVTTPPEKENEDNSEKQEFKKLELSEIINKSRLTEICKRELINEFKALNISEDYPITEDLERLQEMFLRENEKDRFKKLSFAELKELRILDPQSGQYKSAISDGIIDQRGYFLQSSSPRFYEISLLTGTKYDKKGKNIRGYSQKSDDYGFDKNGIHELTKTIHDIRGFMANGFNIQTGTEFDLAGYDINGLKPFYNIEGKLIGGFDRNHNFYENIEDEKTHEIIGQRITRYAKFMSKKGRGGGYVDEFGFAKSEKSTNLIREQMNSNNMIANSVVGEYIDEHIKRNPNFSKFELVKGKYVILNNGTYQEYDESGYNIEGYDKYGFDRNGINRNTGTRFDEDNKSKEEYYDKNRSYLNSKKVPNIVGIIELFQKMNDGKSLNDIITQDAISRKLIVPESKMKIREAFKSMFYIAEDIKIYLLPKILDNCSQIYEEMLKMPKSKLDEIIEVCPDFRNILRSAYSNLSQLEVYRNNPDRKKYTQVLEDMKVLEDKMNGLGDR